MSMISKLCVLLAVLIAGPAARAALIIQIDDLASGGIIHSSTMISI